MRNRSSVIDVILAQIHLFVWPVFSYNPKIQMDVTTWLLPFSPQLKASSNFVKSNTDVRGYPDYSAVPDNGTRLQIAFCKNIALLRPRLNICNFPLILG